MLAAVILGLGVAGASEALALCPKSSRVLDFIRGLGIRVRVWGFRGLGV